MKYATLSWVKPAIDDTLKQTRQSLEQFVENPDDTNPLQDAVNWLHEIHGALTMLDIHTAILLAQEMEAVVRGLLQAQITNKEAAYDAVMRSLIQLPNYLDHLVLNYPDTPLALLGAINKLRALRKQPGLPANQFFLPDPTLPIPVKPAPQLPDDKLKDYLHRLRVVYQKGLMLWLQGPNKAEGLKTLHGIMGKVLQATGGAPVSRMFWITEALIEAVFQKGLPMGEALNNSLKQLDAFLKQLAEHGNAALRVVPPAKLVNTLLFYAAQAKSNGPQIQAVKTAFHLGNYLPSPAQLQAIEQVFSGPDIELMNTVVSTMKDDFARLEETLDIFQRADTPDLNDLAPLIEIMRNAAYTLSLLGLDVQARSMMQQAALIAAVVKGQKPHDLSELLGIANALLKINAALETLGSRGVHARQQIQQEAGLHETQYKTVLRVAVDEAKSELSEVVQPIITFMESGAVDETLTAIPSRLHDIQGLLAVLNQSRAVKLMRLCGEYIAEAMIKQASIPAEAERKALADALVSFEFYLDTLAGNPMDGNRILDTTEQSVRILLPAKV
jgi:chemosensory pili system protein ChpA (sensor histidine kinase/response regulator)